MSDRFRLLAMRLAGLLALAMPAAAQAQQLGGGSGVDVPILRILAALILSLGVVLVLALILRGKASNLPRSLKWLEGVVKPGRIELVETRRISTQAELSLVRCGGREYLILSSAGGVEVLEQHEIESVPSPGDEA